VLAIRAYLNTLAPIHYAPPRNELSFPFNQRWLMVFWNLFNFTEGRFVPDPAAERGMESRRVSGGGARALRGMPYAA
jgi:mono/diheme cytochrome c family protein